MANFKWISGPPNYQQAKAHAKNHPASVDSDKVLAGLWLVDKPMCRQTPEIVPLVFGADGKLDAQVAWTTTAFYEWGASARWLPCTEEGIPLAMTEYGTDDAPVDRTREETLSAAIDRHAETLMSALHPAVLGPASAALIALINYREDLRKRR